MRRGGRKEMGMDDNRNSGGAGPDRRQTETVYESRIKPAADKIFSACVLVMLSPLYAAISIAIYLDDPGPVIFRQKRVGKDKRLFLIHKFRSMKVSAPHEVPTHKLSDSAQYITRTGRILRRTSLDELPQIWDIFRGKMSLIGPRPALWNQTDLVHERDRYGVNQVMPGLTGLAQIYGRDELEIPQKAALDGEYVKILKMGGYRAFRQDAACFAKTVTSVLKQKGVAEGGTVDFHKRMSENTESAGPEAGWEEYGYRKQFYLDRSCSEKVLVTGAGSYIGEQFVRWAGRHYPHLDIQTVDMKNSAWRTYDFCGFDTVFHVAGIAHADISGADESVKAAYYAINTELAVETARKAKESGVRQFIFMSSMIIYGKPAPLGKEKQIDAYTFPAPDSFYGDSKWQADKGIRELASEDFHVAVLRTPMVYGRHSKGNYELLSRMEKTLPLFADITNRRSALHIDNLCEFVCLLVMSGEGGIYFPQNAEYVSTAGLVKQIADVSGRKIHMWGILRPVVKAAACLPGKTGSLVRKASGSLSYSQEISRYRGMDYQVCDCGQSVRRTEKCGTCDFRGNTLVTVITVCRNSEAVIGKTIRSVLNQFYQGIEYLIIDGASTDATVAVARSYEGAFARRGIRYRIIREPDRGIYDAMNKGLRRASGQLAGFINAGDWYEPQAVAVAVQEYEAGSFDYFYGDVRLVRPDGSAIRKRSATGRFPTSRRWNHPAGFAKTSLYKELGYFKCSGIHDDFEFYIRVHKAGKKIVTINQVLASFYVGGISNEKSPDMCIRRIRDRFRAYRQNGYGRLTLLECVGVEVAKYVLGGQTAAAGNKRRRDGAGRRKIWKRYL